MKTYNKNDFIVHFQNNINKDTALKACETYVKKAVKHDFKYFSNLKS